MKKITLSCLGLLLLSITAPAQYYYQSYPSAGENPGGLNTDDEYPVGGGLSNTWSVVSAPSSSPVWSAQQAIPFAFEFNGSSVSSYHVSNSGVLTFSSAPGVAPSFSNSTLPAAGIPDMSVLLWGMAGTGANDYILNKTFGLAPNRQHWIYFSSFSITGITGWQYWSIVLEESTNCIYLVDQRNSNPDVNITAGIQINSGSALMVGNTSSLDALSLTDYTPNDNSYYKFIPGVQPANDITMQAITTNPNQALLSAPFTLSGTILNSGTATITSAEISYSVNGGTPVSGVLNGLFIPPGMSWNFNHPVAWNPGASGSYSISMYPTSVNGSPDGYAGNNLISTTITVVSNATQLTPLFEVFTSSTCISCAVSNPTFDAVLADNPNKFTCVKYQMNGPGAGDPYYNADGGTRAAFYNVSSVPQLMITGSGPNAPALFSQSVFDDAYSKPAFLGIDAVYSTTGTQFNVDVTLNPLVTLSGNIKTFLAVVESPTTGNASTNGETEFFYVEQKMMPNGNGIAVSSLVSGVPVQLTQTYSFSSAAHNVENFNNTRVAVWVQNMTTKEVYQSAFATKVLGAQEIEASNGGIIALYPNPCNDVATLEYRLAEDALVNISIYNALGQQVYQQLNLNAVHGANRHTISLSELPVGSYFVDLQIGNNHYRDHLFRN